MGTATQPNFALFCEFGGKTLCFELTVTSPDEQMKLLRNVSDAYCDFLEELKPEDGALADMVEKGIEDMSRLKDKLEVTQRQHEATRRAMTKKEYLDTEVKSASRSTTQADTNEVEVKQDSQCGNGSDKEARVTPQRHVTFRVEKNIEKDTKSCESSDEEDLPALRKTWRLWPGDVHKIAVRDPAVQGLLLAARDAVDADEQTFHPMVPRTRERATSLPSQLRSAMQAIRLPKLKSSHTTRRVSPKPAQ
eukprot:TRINITY_DN7369_c0_g2_i1.p1 TRINITY_DN7369_c0_g2~~TRINITY_DN7369_c0_g2_i1.p1  ORF type:complete len:270 (+),score=52.66 TRINITY_DN7369_c0_g2_i1:65-811(+)